jgi:antibiotic biosynthesis monooxygenase (ABM) superfamily enzyme
MEVTMDRSATLFIQHRVRASELTRYETWLRIIMAKAAEYPGHQGVHVIRPALGDNEYSIVLRFATGEDAGRWAASRDRQQLLDQIADAIETGDRVEIRSGIDFWFTPAGTVDRRAPAWKQWLVTTGVIWVLTMLVPPLLDPLFAEFPLLGAWGVRHGILAAVIVALVVFLVMPRVTHLLERWLFAGGQSEPTQ